MEHKNTKITKKVISIIDENLHDPNCLKRVDAAILATAPDYNIIFKNERGITPEDYMTKQRLKEAEKLLEREDMSIKDIAKIIGLNGYFEFTQLFKRFNGLSPISYRNQIFKVL